MSNQQIDAMCEAIDSGNCARIDELLADGVSVDTIVPVDKWNFLHLALVSVAIPPNPEAIQHLIEKGVDVNGRDKHGWTPLHFAARTKSVLVVKMLLNAGADVDPVNDKGISPLHLSLLKAPWSLEIAEILLEAGADPDRDRGGGTVRQFVAAVANPNKLALLDLIKKFTGK